MGKEEEETPSDSEEEVEEEEDDEEEEGHDKKRHHLLNNNSCPSIMARQSSSSHVDNNTHVDAGVLQYQNHRLVQQLDAQKHEIHDLETKMKELKDKQSSYDNVLISVNSIWNQLVDDMILLGVRAGAGEVALKHLEQADHFRGFLPACPAEEIFLCRLLQSTSRSNGDGGSISHIKASLALRHSSTLELMKSLEDTIDAEKSKVENVASLLQGEQSSEDTIIKFTRVDDIMKEEAKKLHGVIDVLHSKHKEYCDAIEACNHSHSVDLTQIKSISGDLEESMAELEESRRKLIALKMQKDLAAPIQSPAPVTANGSVSPDKPAEKTEHFSVLKDYVEEAKVLADDRLSELQDAQDDNSVLVKQLQELQTELKEDKHIHSSRPYTLVRDQLHHWQAEAERYRVSTGSLQADRQSIMRREKDIIAEIEAADAARKAIDNSEEKIEELEHEVQKCLTEKNELEIKMEEAMQDSGRQDIKAEFKVMVSSLSKEIRMMEAQLNRWKETAEEAISLRQEAQSLKALLERKVGEQNTLTDKCSKGMAEIKSLKALIERMQREKQELHIVLDMLGQQIYDNRDLMDIKESEQKANAQAEELRNALDEHGLELRVKAANEAEVACQQRLSASEAEIAELRAELDDSDRHVLELREAIKVKEAEAETYICEIETIGQAYEDMQTQHQHLLQQVTERDDYNIKLVSDSVMAKQAHNSLVSENQSLAKQVQQVNTRLESLRSRITRSEEQMKALMMEALTSIPEDRMIALNLESIRWEITDAEKELKWLKSAVSSSEKEYEQMQRKIEEIQMELESERGERQKLDEEISGLNEQITEMTSGSGEAAVQKLQEEINECKAILKCGVCLDRPKEVVIVKCYHLFCNQCIQRNLEIRRRRCPGCGTAFGQNDVRFVKI
ncbi:hypothetical protein Leryth_003973 [Lithospermum erythrorhizon]|nr:hypothetical protein Leryth_003973 [Lithospermum erythrorhizon]